MSQPSQKKQHNKIRKDKARRKTHILNKEAGRINKIKMQKKVNKELKKEEMKLSNRIRRLFKNLFKINAS
ncbi:hypothetical protein KAJ89_03260 [Candidatus Parcubacteria bacterium]|nr:hypothetical protein [Candidatus Parcubacteria bacterium]